MATAMATKAENKDDLSSWLTRIEAMELVGCGLETLARYEKEGRLHPRVRTNAYNRKVTVYDGRELARLPTRHRGRVPKTAGEVAATAFEMFDAGASSVEVIIFTAQTPRMIDELYREWIARKGEPLAITDKQREILASLVGDFNGTDELIANVQAFAASATIEIDGAAHEDVGDAEIERGIVAALDAAKR